MRKSLLYVAAGAMSLLVASIYSCKKVNGIDNNQVIQTPFSLYFADTSGAIFNTNNGKDINPQISRADGKPVRAMCVSENNLLYAKDNLYVSINNGQNFNHSYDSLLLERALGCTSRDTVDLNQSMILDMPKDNRLYTMSRAPFSLTPNYLGLVFSDGHGIRGSWHFDATYDTVGDMGKLPVNAISITQMKNGVVAALALNTQDPTHAKTLRNIFTFNNASNFRWYERTGNPSVLDGVGGLDQSGTPLPPNASQPDTGFFTLGHFNNRLIAIDHKCLYGAYYSDDTGKNWRQFTGLPTATSLLCVESPFEEVCLIGTSGKGLWIYNTHTESWEQNNKGLSGNLVVRSIAAKKNIFKNGTVQKYIFLATNQGIFQSLDGGLNWTKTIPGNFVSVY